MATPKTSIGTGSPGGIPANSPPGPYITDTDDGTHSPASKVPPSAAPEKNDAADAGGNSARSPSKNKR